MDGHASILYTGTVTDTAMSSFYKTALWWPWFVPGEDDSLGLQVGFQTFLNLI